MRIELLWWEGCPSTEKTLAELRQALRDVGRGDETVALREIQTDEEALAMGFRGSPTVLVDGVDLVPDADGAQIGLSCRVYRRRDGRISPTPDPDDLRDALRAAAARAAGRPADEATEARA